jgi:hypothetical protein
MFLMRLPLGCLRLSADGKYLMPPVGPKFLIERSSPTFQAEMLELKPVDTPSLRILEMDCSYRRIP